jgi:hypothetical protein
VEGRRRDEHLHADQRFRRGKNLEISEVPDGYMVINTDTRRVHYLNMVAAVVLELCDGAHSVASIVGILRDEFDLAQAPEAPVASCLSTLQNEGLIVACDR